MPKTGEPTLAHRPGLYLCCGCGTEMDPVSNAFPECPSCGHTLWTLAQPLPTRREESPAEKVLDRSVA